jgi:hypothetical protein
VSSNEPLTGEIIAPVTGASTPAAAEYTAAGRPLYWHVFGAPLAGTKGSAKNHPMITAGPVTKSPDSEVQNTTIPGEDGKTVFVYLGTFDHDPSDTELRSLRPKAYK